MAKVKDEVTVVSSEKMEAQRLRLYLYYAYCLLLFELLVFHLYWFSAHCWIIIFNNLWSTLLEFSNMVVSVSRLKEDSFVNMAAGAAEDVRRVYYTQLLCWICINIFSLLYSFRWPIVLDMMRDNHFCPYDPPKPFSGVLSDNQKCSLSYL